MEQEPGKKMSYKDVLNLAKTDKTDWVNIQIWTLEDYLVRIAGEKPNIDIEQFSKRLRTLNQYTLESLKAIGEEYRLLADYDLETESLKTFCHRNNIELVEEK